MNNLVINLKKIWAKIYNNKVYHMLAFFFLFLIILCLLSFLTRNLNLSYFYSYIIHNLLNNLNISNELFFNGINHGLLVFDSEINILEVCTGLFELCVFVALIFANLKVSFRNKFIGLIFLLFLFFYFNIIRIFAMIFLIGFVNLNLVNVLHTIFFKLGFFIFFIFFYYAWLVYSDSYDKI
jgi:exosortase/archaeosortase family protein